MPCRSDYNDLVSGERGVAARVAMVLAHAGTGETPVTPLANGAGTGGTPVAPPTTALLRAIKG
ncbi:MAG: hypothetical protein ACLPHI_19305 [Terriglobales bacterium]